MAKKGILQLLKEGPVVGDGSMCMTLEKRGYCRAGPWTPEAVLLYPEAVRQLLREYLRSGADVLQTPCFYSSDGKLEVTTEKKKPTYSTKELNDAACIMAHEVANEGSAIVCGSLSPVISYTREGDLQKARQEFERQLEPFMEHNVDFILAEFFAFIGEVELCVDVMKKANKPIACTMRIGEHGDENGVSVEECALRMARTGADIIGINCMYDISTNLKTLKRMKVALDAADLHPYLMVQPLGFRCPEVEKEPIVGYLSLPDAPLALDSRVLTRTEVHQFTRAAYDIGVRYIGGCCGMEPHHIRAIAQELAPERKRPIPVDDMCPAYGGFLKFSAVNVLREKSGDKDFWQNVNIGSGRPDHKACNEPMKNVLLA